MIEGAAGEKKPADWAEAAEKAAAEKAAEESRKAKKVLLARLFAALVFLCIGIFSAIVGAHDAFSSVEVASRFGGLLLLLAALALITVGILLLVKDFSSWTPTAGVLISPLGAIVGLSFVSAQLLSIDRDWWPVWIAIGIGAVVLGLGIGLRLGLKALISISAGALFCAYLYFLDGDHDERLIIWAAIIFASGVACFALWQAQPPSVSISAPRVVGGIFGFFTLSALIGGAQLWYTSQYLPESLGASLSVESQLTREGVWGRMEAARLTLSIENTGQIQARVLGSLYRVTAAPMHAIRRGDLQMQGELGEPELDDLTVSRFRRSFRWDVVQAGHIFPDDAWLDPEERYSTSTLVYLPRGKYDTLRSKAVVMMAKNKVLTLGEAEEPESFLEPTQPVREVVTAWPIDETSWFRQLTHSDRELEIDWVTGRRGNFEAARFPYLSVGAHRVGSNAYDVDDFDAYNKELFAEYGLGEALSSTEMALGQPGASRR